MRNHTIAIQGAASSYHDLAARKFFGEEITVRECGSFREVCERISANQCDYGVMAIENQVAGSILLNYRFIDQYRLSIIGETYLPVELHLAALPGTKPEEVREIVSHPMALAQAQIFLSGLRSVLVTEYKDTATCAQLVSKEKLPGLAVIAGPAVIRANGLEPVVRDVGDAQHNFTRFYVLSKYPVFVPDANKATLILKTENKPGRLAAVLQFLARKGHNLTRVQSIPIPEMPEQYAYHLDVEFSERGRFDKTIAGLTAYCEDLRVAGIYRGDMIPLPGISEPSTSSGTVSA